jgi:hypothetical protein
MKGSWQRANQPLEPIAAPLALPAQLFVTFFRISIILLRSCRMTLIRKLEKGKSDKMIYRRCFNLSLICVLWLSANAIAFGQISDE